MAKECKERCPPGWGKCDCGRWTKWKFWNGYHWKPRCFDCGKIYGRTRSKGGDNSGDDLSVQQEGDTDTLSECQGAERAR